MVNIITVHSAREGTGKSTIVANIATLLAAAGQRVGIVDANLKDWSLHCHFNLGETQIQHTFNDYLIGLCDGNHAAYDVTPDLDTLRMHLASAMVSGHILLVPASTHSNDLARVLREGYSIDLITDGLWELARQLRLDVLLIDTHAGLNEETLLSLLAIAIADVVLIVLRMDQRDYQGTGVTLDIARTLRVPQIHLVANQVLPAFDTTEARQRLEEVFHCPVAAILPHTEEMALLGNTGIFVLRYPTHPVTQTLQQLTRTVMNQIAHKPV